MNIRNIYLYLFSFIGLLIVVIGMVQVVDLALNVWVFPDADLYDYGPRYPLELAEPGAELDEKEQAAYEAEMQAYSRAEQTRSRQRQLSGSLAMLLVGVPLYLYHWRIISRERLAANG